MSGIARSKIARCVTLMVVMLAPVPAAVGATGPAQAHTLMAGLQPRPVSWYPHPQISTGVGVIDNFGNPGYKCLSDHGHTSNIDIESSGCGLWTWVNQQRWTDPLTKHIVTVVELQDTRYGLCINLDNSNDFYYLDSCVRGDKNELFWVDGYLEVNVQATDVGFCDPYYADMTTSAVVSGDDVYVGCAATTNAEDAWAYQ